MIKDVQIEKILLGERKRNDWGAISELASSMKRDGLMEPVVVMGEKHFCHQLVMGARRLRAAQFLNWKVIPCLIITHFDDLPPEAMGLHKKPLSRDEMVAMGDLITRIPVRQGGPYYGRRGHKTLYRRRIREVVGFSYAQYKKIKFIFNAAKKYPENKLFQEAAQAIRKGSPVGGHWKEVSDELHWIEDQSNDQLNEKRKPLTSKAAQVISAAERAATSIEFAVSELERIELDDVTHEQTAEIEQSLTKIRTRITRVINSLRSNPQEQQRNV